MEKAGQDLGLAGQALVSNANKGVTQVRGGFDAHRQERYEMREFLHGATNLKRVQSCGRVSVLMDGIVEVRYRDGIAGYHGPPAVRSGLAPYARQKSRVLAARSCKRY